MAAYSVEFHPLARREFEKARLWYRHESLDASDRFVEAVERGVRQIATRGNRIAVLEKPYH